ncbi:hypothetical protein AP1H75_09960 [Apilactobacillus apinorum]|uniref:hypothetical protein n=1 Tax=Apilactobacillus apinorum TaxID=1218495 RepID=UPI0030EACE38
MRDITEIACESYKEDLRTYDDKNYQIKYKNYDWKLAILAYRIMIDEFTDYNNLEQPEEDYLAFDKENNAEVMDMVGWLERNYRIQLLLRDEYKDVGENKGVINLFGKFYYRIQKKR